MPTLTSSTGGADSETRIVSPMPLLSSEPNATELLIVPWNAGPGLGHAEVERPVAALGEHLVRLHHHDRVVVLDRDLEVVEVVLLEQRRLPDGRLDERLGRRLAVLLEDALVERAGVDADADRDAGVLGRLGDRADLVVELADVAGIDAYGSAARVDRGEDVLRLEVDVGDDRDVGVLGDLGERVGVVLARARHSYDVAACSGELGDLLQRRVDVGGQRRRHRLHRHRGVAADVDRADLDLAGLAPGSEHRRRHRRQAEVRHESASHGLTMSAYIKITLISIRRAPTA